MNQALTPYATLTPETILDAVESLGLATDGRILALNSYENRVYQVQLDDGSAIIVKFYRPHRWSDAQILEEHNFIASLASQEIPVVAALHHAGSTLHEYQNFRFSLFPKQGGRAPEIEDLDVLTWIGRLIGRIHAVGALSAFNSRPQVDIESYVVEPTQYLLENGFIPEDIRPAYESVLKQALICMQQLFNTAGTIPYIRTHADCHLGNILWTHEGPHFVDFDDCRMAPAIQDIWMMLSGSQQEMRQQLHAFLEGYEDFYDFNPVSLHLVEALRTMRLIHFSAWIAKRWQDPAFPIAFPWFNTQQYWQNKVLELREQIALMQEPPILLVR